MIISRHVTPGVNYVARVNPATPDMTQAVLTKDGNWHDLDLSAIIPITTKLLHLYVTLSSNAGNTSLHFRPHGYTNGLDIVELKNPTGATSISLSFFIKPVIGVIDYAVLNVAGLGVNIVVIGWFL